MEVWNPGAKKAGTGYLVSTHLVLTAYHNVRRGSSGAGGQVEVRRLGLGAGETWEWVAAKVLWPDEPPDVDVDADPVGDAALLMIMDDAWQPPECPPLTWGRLSPPSADRGRVDCVAVGFPQSEKRDGLRDTKEIRGHIETLTGLKSGLISAHVDRVATPHGTAPASLWAGASGAALFCGTALVGILTVDRAKDYPASLLTAVPVAELAARPGFTTTIRATGSALTLKDVTASAAPVPGSAYDIDAPKGLNNLPDLSSPVFVGRADALRELAAALHQDSQAITQTVQGLGGVGKTTLALHYAHAHLDTYRLVWWIHADTPDLITTDLAALTGRLRGGGTGSLTTPEAADWAIGWLQAHPGWLLVLDNAEHPGVIASLTGQLRHAGRHLITTRYADDWATAPLALPVLDDDDALRLLTELTGLNDPGNQDQARLLAEELGHLPLALEQAGAFIRQSRLATVREYRDLLHEHTAHTLDAPADRTRPERAMARIWRVTLDRLAEQDPLTVDILRTAAWLAATPLPRDLFTPLADHPVHLARALGLLAAYNMIGLESDTLTVHRLVQTVARTPDTAAGRRADPHRTPEAVEAARYRATVLLSGILPSEPRTNVTGWPLWRMLLPHIQALTDAADPTQDSTETNSVIYHASLFMRGQGLIDQAIHYAERSADADARIHGPDHPDTLVSRDNLAGTYEAAGDLTRAIPLYEATLADRERVLGPDHPDTLTSRNNLAYAHQLAGDHTRALPLHKATLADRERVLDPDHPNTLVSRNNLAGTYEAAGDHTRAIPLYEATLADTQRILGPDHPHTLGSRNNLAYAYQAAGDHTRAIPLYEATLADTQRILGPDHPDTLTSRNNLAYAHQLAGDHTRALPLHKATLADRERVLGPDHPNTLVSRNNLAYAYKSTEDHTRALPLYEATLADRERVLGPDHPDTLTSRNNLAGAYRSTGDLTRALPLYEAAFHAARRVHGDHHPVTRAIRGNLIGTYLARR
ncbi:tetratricopeptide repeat protein [Streptomyces hirsutus]|uniref:tetratricopeptide repeat protein n=1 Tax=Streptomyces hirsutus TaxID=35620 RepID=UPI00363B8DB2